MNLLLLVFSLVFFCWGGFKVAVKTLPALASIVVWNYLLALLSKKWKPFLSIGVVGNLAFFFYYKIWNEFARLIDGLLSSNLTIEKLVIPIGLSFILFHGISYLLDIRHGKVKPNRNFAEFALYMLFFPKLAQGPIVKYYEFEPYLRNRKVVFEDLVSGLERFIVGLAKKVLVADVLALTVNRIFSVTYGQMDVASAWLGSILFTLQIYLDFSGYSDMAIGIGRMFGFRIPENFNFPYASTSISEFWRRWHITLGAWFREYLYIPLGGSRKGNVYLHLFIVFLVTGIWHGSSLVFILWGICHGLCVMMERFLVQKGWYEKIPKILRWLYTMLVVNIGWIAFKTPTLDMFKTYIKHLLGMIPVVEPNFIWSYYLLNQRIVILILFVMVCLCIFQNERVQECLRKWDKRSVGFSIVKYVLLTILFVLSVCAVTANKYQPFIYFQF
ncbi:MAG: hypothetical protein K2I87_04575 [Bacteroidales bacterium]|nr:hypothetical protein [Bacteroidales bacterium]